MEMNILDVQGQEKGKINLPALFETKVTPALLHEVSVAFLANQRSGTASTKTRGEVSGGGKKPWKQKGTGNARSGSNRSPLWRKGGIIFGPRPHGYYQNMPQQKKQIALKMALSVKAANGNLIVLDTLPLQEAKTKSVAAILKKLDLENKKILIVVDKVEKNLKLASKNIQDLIISNVNSLNMYQVLWAKKLVITSAAIEQLKGK
jgi:large subunit ribosomal protein L4